MKKLLFILSIGLMSCNPFSNGLSGNKYKANSRESVFNSLSFLDDHKVILQDLTEINHEGEYVISGNQITIANGDFTGYVFNIKPNNTISIMWNTDVPNQPVEVIFKKAN